MTAAVRHLPVSRADRDWASAPHALFGLCLLVAPFTHHQLEIVCVVPLISAGWMAWRTRDSKPFAARHTRESVNLQLTFQLSWVVAVLALSMLTKSLGSIWFAVVLGSLYLTALAFSWIGCERAAKGRDYRIPVAIPFLR